MFSQKIWPSRKINHDPPPHIFEERKSEIFFGKNNWKNYLIFFSWLSEFKVILCSTLVICWGMICLTRHLEKWNSKGRSGYNFDQFLIKSRKLGLSIDGLIIHRSLRDATVSRKAQNYFWRISQNSTPSALLNFTSLCGLLKEIA